MPVAHAIDETYDYRGNVVHRGDAVRAFPTGGWMPVAATVLELSGTPNGDDYATVRDAAGAELTVPADALSLA